MTNRKIYRGGIILASVTLDLDAKGYPVKINLFCDFSENDTAKSIIGHYFSKTKSCWTYPFSLFTYKEIVRNYPDSVSIDMASIVEKVELDNKKILELKNQEDSSLSTKMSSFLYNYQRVAVKLMLEIENPLLADDMGIGKTLESICTCEEINDGTSYDDLKVLVVCPNSLKWTWSDEIENWKSKVNQYDPERTIKVIDGTPKQKDKQWASPGKYTIINYEGLTSAGKVYYEDLERIESSRNKRNEKRVANGLPPKKSSKKIWEDDTPDKVWDVLIVDEGHRIKNRKSMYTEAIKSIKAKKVIVVTGTPIMNRVDELWSILNRLYPTKYTSYWNFVDKYCEVAETKFGKKITGAKNLDALQEELAPIMIRRTKEEIMEDLPDKSYQKIMVEMSSVQKKLYHEMRTNLVAHYMKSIISLDTDTLLSSLKEDRLSEKVILNFSTIENGEHYIGDNIEKMNDLLGELDKTREEYILIDVRSVDLSEYVEDNSEEDYLKKAEYKYLEAMFQKFKNMDERIAIVISSHNIFKNAMDSVGNLSASTLLAQTTRLRQIAISAGLIASDYKADAPKIDTLMDILPEYLDNNKKGVVMSQFSQALKLLTPKLDAAGIKYVVLTGEVPIPERQKLVKQFQTDDSIKLFLCTIKAGGVGITLTRASTIFFLDRDWTPAMNEQAEDRLHRTGQKDNVLVVDLIAKDTVEAHVWQLLRKKQDIFDQVIDIRQIIDVLKSDIM